MEASTVHPFQKNQLDTNHAFAELKEGDMFAENRDLLFVIAIIKKNLVVIYQGTQSEMRPICYTSSDEVRKKFALQGQSGYWVNYLGNDKAFTDKLLND
jgi:hypothetical protein